MKAFVFPGQGAQFPGMGKDLFDVSEIAKQRFNQANDVLGFDIANICLLYTSPSPRDRQKSRMPSSA